MKRKIYLGIVTLITVICIIFGAIYHLNVWESHTEEYVENESLSGTKEQINAFEKIRADIEIMDICIMSGNDYMVEYECNQERLVPQYEVKNGVLIITQKAYKSIVSSTDNKCRMYVEIPVGIQLKGMYINSSVGDVTVENIMAKNIEVVTEVGNADINDSEFDDIYVTTQVGNASINKCCFNNVEVECEVGDAKIIADEDMSGYDMLLTTDIGNITINGDDQKKDYEVIRGDKRQLTLKTDVGNIDVTYPKNK